MLIFNTTYLVSDNVRSTWLKWIQEKHIPFMLESNLFSKPQLARIITSAEDEGTSFSLQFNILDMNTLKKWNQQYKVIFQENCSREFGTEVVFFTTILEMIEKK